MSIVQSEVKADPGTVPPIQARINAPAGPLPRRLRDILALDDYERVARKLLPKPIFGFVSGGAETNWTVRANRSDFGDYAFRPRVLIDTAQRSTTTMLFGRTYAAPFGIAPMGGSGLSCFRADEAMTRAAQAADLPFILSGASLLAMERLAAVDRSIWIQAYLVDDSATNDAYLDRVAAAGFETLVITVDVPVPGNRENNVRNGYTSPLRPSLRLAWEGLTHPRWLLGTALKTLWHEGMPHLENYGPTRGIPVFSRHSVERIHARARLSWAEMERLRNRWKGRMILKGILTAEDTHRAREVGADGVIVSNHGGRQLDGAMPSIAALPEAVEAAGSMVVMIDGGFRRGSDVLKALALGARFVFIGRPFLYAACVGGESGLRHAFHLLSEEISRNMAMLGCCDVASLDRHSLHWRG